MIYRLNQHENGNFSMARFHSDSERWLPIDHEGLTFDQVEISLRAFGFVAIDDYVRGAVRQTIYAIGGL